MIRGTILLLCTALANANSDLTACKWCSAGWQSRCALCRDSRPLLEAPNGFLLSKLLEWAHELDEGNVFRQSIDDGARLAAERVSHPEFPIDDYSQLAAEIDLLDGEGEEYASSEDMEQLAVRGYLLKPSVIQLPACRSLHAMVELMATWDLQNSSSQPLVHRVEHLAFTPGHPSVWDKVAAHPLILSVAEQLFDDPVLVHFTTFNTRVGARVADLNPGLHIDGLANLPMRSLVNAPAGMTRDQYMDSLKDGIASAWNEEMGYPSRSMTAIVYLNDFTAQNGATAVLPGSHLWTHTNPYSNATAQECDRGGKLPLTQATGPAGSILFINASTWHRASDHSSSGVEGSRIALQLSFADAKPAQRLLQGLSNRSVVGHDSGQRGPYTTIAAARGFLSV